MPNKKGNKKKKKLKNKDVESLENTSMTYMDAAGDCITLSCLSGSDCTTSSTCETASTCETGSACGTTSNCDDASCWSSSSTATKTVN